MPALRRRPRASRRPIRAAWCALLVAAPLIATAVATDTGAAAAAPATSSGHPYSMPVWLPIRDETYLDCVLSNPGCGNTHSHWTTAMVLETLRGKTPKSPGIYAMGAGILHIEKAKGHRCADGAKVDFGTTAWIDHGGGVTSRYGHLKNIWYKAGTLLAAGQRFATMGTTGKNGNCGVPYVNFQVRTRGIAGPTKRLDTLKVCGSPTSAVTWPAALDARKHVRPAPLYPSKVRKTYRSFNDVPKRTIDFPATTSSCMSKSIPATPNKPVSVRLKSTARGKMTVSWRKPGTKPKVTSVQVQLSEYHPSTRTWDYAQNEEYRTVSPKSASYTFTRLVRNHTYRATVTFRNGTGYGKSVRTSGVKATR